MRTPRNYILQARLLTVNPALNFDPFSDAYLNHVTLSWFGRVSIAIKRTEHYLLLGKQ